MYRDFTATEDLYKHLIKSMHETAKEALVEEPGKTGYNVYFWNKEIGEMGKYKHKPGRKFLRRKITVRRKHATPFKHI